mmetsp:Transcript_89074/g.288479  ORF Transcript_89074/g.288479 Transcript_89074/m.288479 type:complete len:258 (+) Transcript_89074:208-981(+)
MAAVSLKAGMNCSRTKASMPVRFRMMGMARRQKASVPSARAMSEMLAENLAVASCRALTQGMTMPLTHWASSGPRSTRNSSNFCVTRRTKALTSRSSCWKNSAISSTSCCSVGWLFRTESKPVDRTSTSCSVDLARPTAEEEMLFSSWKDLKNLLPERKIRSRLASSGLSMLFRFAQGTAKKPSSAGASSAAARSRTSPCSSAEASAAPGSSNATEAMAAWKAAAASQQAPKTVAFMLEVAPRGGEGAAGVVRFGRA